MNPELIEKLKKFTNDPDWHIMADIMKGHFAPLYDVMSIDIAKSNDEIASEVRGRQMTVKGITAFLNDAKIISGNIKSIKTTFK